MAFKSLFKKYKRLVIFDTETTGLDCRKDQIIEFAAVVIEKKGIIKEFDELIQLEPGTRIPDSSTPSYWEKALPIPGAEIRTYTPVTGSQPNPAEYR